MKSNNISKSIISNLLLALVLCFVTIGCQKNKITDPDVEIVNPPPAPEIKYELEWADEFDGTALNMTNWTHDVGYNMWGNNEQENYQAANVAVGGGNLQITAKKETIGNVTQSKYTSGRIHTLNKREFTYGKIEAKMKLPKGQGLWPAFWMLGVNMRPRGNTPGVGWPACGEIDIMETINSEIWTSAAAHWAKPDGTHTNSGNKLNIPEPDGWHVYSLEWTKEYLKWYVDGKFYNGVWIKNGASSTSEFHAPFNIILNLAVGGDWPGQTVNEVNLPATMLVDYVRVYKEAK